MSLHGASDRAESDVSACLPSIGSREKRALKVLDWVRCLGGKKEDSVSIIVLRKVLQDSV